MIPAGHLHNHQIETAYTTYTTAHSAKAERPADLISAGGLFPTASHRDRARRQNRDALRIMDFSAIGNPMDMCPDAVQATDPE